MTVSSQACIQEGGTPKSDAEVQGSPPTEASAIRPDTGTFAADAPRVDKTARGSAESEPKGSSTWERWALDSIPLFTVGLLADDPLLDVGAGLLLPGGKIVLASGGGPFQGGRELRFYDAQGTVVRVTGRFGQGPGEYRSIDWMGSPVPDTIVVHDRALRRMSVLDADGSFRRLFSLRAPSGVPIGGPRMVGALGATQFLVRWLGPGLPTTPGSLGRAEDALALYDATGQMVRSYGTRPGIEFFRGPVRSGQMPLLGHAPFAPIPSYSTAGGFILEAPGLRYETLIVDSVGAVRAIVGDSAAPQRITEEIRAEFVSGALEGVTDERRVYWAEVYRMYMTPHDVLPMLADMRSDALSNIWMRRRMPYGAAGEWDVYALDGAHLAKIEVPVEYEILDISAELLLVRHRGQFDEDLVSVYRVVK